jgi:hypothetical protein
MILAGRTDVAAWNYLDAIHVHNGAFDWGSTPQLNALATQQTILHELGHNWDSPDENPSVGQFRSLSGWSRDGNTHRANESTDFARRYGATDALEDFATAFAAHFMKNEYIDYENGWTFADYTNRPVMQRKLTYMDFFDSTA